MASGLSARCAPRLSTAGDSPARWNREKTHELSFSHCGVFPRTDVSVNEFSVSLIQLSVSEAAAKEKLKRKEAVSELIST